jgi:CheY-like chemotaxis protein
MMWNAKPPVTPPPAAPRILVVDDAAMFRDPLAAGLTLAGYDAACAADGAEALAAVAARRPDLILLDLAMPVMDGVSFLRALRAREGGGRIPVIVLSAAAEQRVAFEAGALGADDYLVKSRASLEEMIERVGQTLARGRPAGAAAGPRLTATPAPKVLDVPAFPVSPAPVGGATTVGALPPGVGGTPGGRVSRANSQPPPPVDPRQVHVMCPRRACGRVMSVDPELRGTSVPCTHCGGLLRVPRQRGATAGGAGNPKAAANSK